MAHQIWHEVQTPKRGRRVFSGSLAPNGAGAVSGLKGTDGFDQALRIGVGEFQVWLDSAYSSLESVTLSLQLAAVTDRFIRCTTFTNTTGPLGYPQTVINIAVVDGANAAQEIAADANNRVNFTICVGSD